MGSSGRRNSVIHFLIVSFNAILLFSVFIFIILAFYMSQKSKQAISEIGEIYMSEMNQQMSEHFDTVIGLRFDQVKGLASVVPAENNDIDALYEELIYRAQVRDFDYLALCSEEGVLETLYGEPIQPCNPAPFAEALAQGDQRVAIGVDAKGNDVVLFGTAASYPTRSGGVSTGLVAAVPLEYITQFLSLQNSSQLVYYHIIRSDGSLVIQNENTELLGFLDALHKLMVSEEENATEEKTLEVIGDALRDGKKYSAAVEVNGETRQIYGTPLPYSEWYLVAVMPYDALDNIANALSDRRIVLTLLSCAAIVVFLTLCFVRYYSLTRSQVHELEIVSQKAFEASKAKSEFLANMSHDIRTPMNAIVGMTAVATTHIDDKDQVKYCLKKIALSSRHLLGLINDVLDMSKIESGKMTITTEIVSLKEVVEGIVAIMHSQMNAKKQNFEIYVESDITESVWSDGVRLNQVLLNVLSNATKYTPEGGSIGVSLFEEGSPKGEDYARIHIKVKDNGIGMSPEFLERIFESYRRADEARVHKSEGAGLGMAITKYIVDAMEGTIDVQSELNTGTEFHLVFDFKKASEADANTAMVLSPWNMLVVDDDKALCTTAVETLESIGIHAEWALSGEMALEKILNRHSAGTDYQIILLDRWLTGMDGIQVAREIRRILEEEAPMLLISAYDWSEFEAEAREAGINGFIPKPLFKSTLFNALCEYMGIKTSQDQMSEQVVDLAGHHILLAEDNELNWEIANDLLSDLGLKLDWAEDGQICLDMFRESSEGHYDAILMDLRMPRMTGYEATAAIRRLDRSDASSIPIIAMSADAFSDDVKRCHECGMDGHIAKPVDIGELARLLRRYLAT